MTININVSLQGSWVVVLAVLGAVSRGYIMKDCLYTILDIIKNLNRFLE